MKCSINRNASVLLLTLVILLVISPVSGYANPLKGTQGPVKYQPADSSATTKVYLPVVLNKSALVKIFGAETKLAYDTIVADRAINAGISWIRSPAFSWKDIEPVDTRHSLGHPTYDWTKVNEVNLNNLAARGIMIMGTIKYTPTWAQKVPPYSCGPIAQVSLDEFAQFVTALIQRYGSQVKYWEIGNEPDVDPSGVDNPDKEFGCWGDQTDLKYYGGGYYAKMLEIVYPAIKAADPLAQLVTGGLLLDCDPTNPPPGKTCLPANFFEGILDNNGKKNGANFFDIVGFHAGAAYDGTLLQDENNIAWKNRGGVVLGKIDFLRSVMAKYGVNKPIFLNEGAFSCPGYYPAYCGNDQANPPVPPVPSFFEAQADYVVWYFVRNWAAGLIGTIWYRLDGESWRYSSLLDSNQSPKPAYYSLQFLSTELKDARFIQKITLYPNLRVYEFQTVGRRIWVMWSPDQQARTTSLPAGTSKVLDKYGAIITPVNNQITVNSPVYIEIVP